MLDLDSLRRVARGEGPAVPMLGDDGTLCEGVLVTRDFLERAADELAEGRAARSELQRERAMQGVMFALREGQRL